MNFFVVVKKLLFSLSISMLLACQGAPQVGDTSQRQLSRVLSGDALLTQSDETPLELRLPDDQPFAITEEMKVFVHHFAPKSMNSERRLRNLVLAMMEPWGLKLSYNPSATYSSIDTFTHGEANCLSFTMLLIALADEAGLKAEFNEVDVPPTWDLQDDNRLIFYRHVNALVTLPMAKKTVVDINLEEYNQGYNQHKLSRVDAEAMYYNNRGAEAMAAGDNIASFLNFRKALALNDQLGFIWGNLGVLYKRAGHLDLAEASFSHALSFGEFEPVAGSNLAHLYRETGREAQALEIETALENFRARNPYYQYAQALSDFKNDKPSEALASINKAIALYGKDHRFYHLRAQIHARMGLTDAVNQDLAKAKSASQELDEKDKYQSKLDRLASLH